MNYFLLSTANVNMRQEELNDKAFFKKLSDNGLKVKDDETLGLICEYSGTSEHMAMEMFADLYWAHFHPGVLRF